MGYTKNLRSWVWSQATALHQKFWRTLLDQRPFSWYGWVDPERHLIKTLYHRCKRRLSGQKWQWVSGKSLDPLTHIMRIGFRSNDLLQKLQSAVALKFESFRGELFYDEPVGWVVTYITEMLDWLQSYERKGLRTGRGKQTLGFRKNCIPLNEAGFNLQTQIKVCTSVHYALITWTSISVLLRPSLCRRFPLPWKNPSQLNWKFGSQKGPQYLLAMSILKNISCAIRLPIRWALF